MRKIITAVILISTLSFSYQNCGQVTLDKVSASSVPSFSLNVELCNFENFETKTFFSYNRNMKLIDGYYYVDSDGDGLTDEFESNIDNQEKYGINPRVKDSNLDGYDDLTVVSFDINIDQQNNLSVCVDTVSDSDRDGLNDCTENLIMTDLKKPDTDGDAIPDRIEILNGLNAIDDKDAYSDVDSDGVINIDEIKLGLPVHLSNNKFQSLAIDSKLEVLIGKGCKLLSFSNLPFFEYLDPNHIVVEVLETNSAGEQVLRKLNYHLTIENFKLGYLYIDMKDALLFDNE